MKCKTYEVKHFLFMELYVSYSEMIPLLTRSVQEDVFFSVDVTCLGIPTIQWTFMSGAVSLDYSSRVQPFNNGSMGLSDLRLQDAGYYVVTVTDTAGSSKDAGFVLKVNEVLYEDLQYLSVSALALACVAVLLMLATWLLDKAYRKIVAWRRKKEMPGKQCKKNSLKCMPLCISLYEIPSCLH
uniref:V-set and transmembrane domain containing 5 n=1 Tax=Sander lucioperca TaxID=283035 RepID=A0A8C9ZN01_SANLU